MAPPSRSSMFENRTRYSGPRLQSTATAMTAISADAAPSSIGRGMPWSLLSAGKRAMSACAWLIASLRRNLRRVAPGPETAWLRYACDGIREWESSLLRDFKQGQAPKSAGFRAQFGFTPKCRAGLTSTDEADGNERGVEAMRETAGCFGG